MSFPVFDFPLVETPALPTVPTDVQTDSMIRTAKQMMLLRTSVAPWLDVIGNNYGIPRPDQTNDDEIYRRCIMVLAWQPKTILFTTYGLMSAVFGTQDSFVAQNIRPWRIYEVNPNEFIIEIPSELLATSNENATYLHGWSGYAFVASGPTDTFTTPGDVSQASATTLVGKNLYVYISGTWTAYTVSTFSYSSSTNTSTIKLSAATLPAGGGPFYLDVPGDGTASYPGDFLATSGFVGSYSTTAGPATNTLHVVGDCSQDVDTNGGQTIHISISGTVTTRVVSSVSYSSTTNISTVVITTTDVPGGLAGETFLLPEEAADTPTTAPHGLRVYITGTGLFEIVKFYMDLLVRAAGIVMRLEII